MADDISKPNHLPIDGQIIFGENPLFKKNMAAFISSLGEAVLLIHHNVLNDIDKMVYNLKKIILHDVLGSRVS